MAIETSAILFYPQCHKLKMQVRIYSHSGANACVLLANKFAPTEGKKLNS